jgi:diguanylate cyclase (GGDEF)-like protein
MNDAAPVGDSRPTRPPSHEPEEARLDPVRSAFDTAVDLLEAERASLLLRDEPEGALVVNASLGIPPRLAAAIRVKIGHGIAGMVAQRGHPVLGQLGGRTFLSVPVFSDRGLEGVLNVTDRQGGREYSMLELEVAARAAVHIGTLVEYGRQASRDPVSGLHNRQTFEEALEREIARSDRTGGVLAVVFLDLDNLKMMNDRYGHEQGDAAIRAVGDIVRHILRPYDIACRWGGDEFVLLLTGIDERETAAAISAVTSRIAEAATEHSKSFPFNISISVGVALWPADGETGRQLMASADSRMYEHKRSKQVRIVT